MDSQELWQAVLARIQFNISQPNFATWFRNTKIAEIRDAQMIIAVPNNFSKEWLENKYHKLISRALFELDPNIKEVKYLVSPLSPVQPLSVSKTGRVPPFSQPRSTVQLDLHGFSLQQESGLNNRYRFDNFIIGSFNELAHATAWGVAEKPGLVYNPLFIYGGVGLGKTHLLQAIGNHLKEKNRKRKIKYVTSEKFTSDMVNAIRNNELEIFKARYREVDLLIIDDVQFISGKEKTQEEFFHVFNVLYQSNKQIVLSSDRPPRAIAALEARLRSRFEGGMLADISLPDFETRLAILKIKAKEKTLTIPDNILGLIAERIKVNIRELEGALNMLAAQHKVSHQEITPEQAAVAVRKIMGGAKKTVPTKKVLQTVAEFYDLKEQELIKSSRRQEIVRPRQIAMYLLREEFKYSYPLIGRKFGGKDHTTAIYAAEKIKQELERNENLLEEITLIKQRIFSE